MIVKAFKCPHTGKLFEEHQAQEYKNHVRAARRKIKKEQEKKQIVDNFWNWLKEEKSKILYVHDIVPWFLENQHKIMEAHSAGVRSKYFGFNSKCYPETDKFTKLEISKLRFSRTVSNTHVCPDNGVTNWWSNKELPIGYEGWTGYITGTLKREPKHMSEYPYSELINLVGLKTGTGGGGNENWGYDIRIFLDDWPGLQHQRFEEESDQIVDIIKGKK